MKQFQISTRNSGRLRTVQVCIHDSLEDMRAAANRLNKRIGSEEKLGSNVHGLCQKYTREKYVNKKWVKLPDAGFIRLYRGALRTGIVTHECTHMAWGIYQEDIQKTIPDMEREERLCYLVGDLSSKLVGKLYHYRMIPEPGK
jgi:hypothetical protein